MNGDDSTAAPATYSGLQKTLHWVIAFAVIGMVPVGLALANFDFEETAADLGEALYGWHKLIGAVLLVLMAVRLATRIVRGTPALPPDLPDWQAVAARAVQGAMYTLLFVVPLLGWAGATAFSALGTVGGIRLPAMPFVPADQALAMRMFAAHGALAMTLAVLALAHIAAALDHLLRRKDGVFARMWPGRAR